MGRIKHSAAWWCYVRGEMTPELFVRTAAEIGYDAVEIVDPLYWQLVKDHGLTIASVLGHKTLVDGLNKRENHARIAALTTESCCTLEGFLHNFTRMDRLAA